MRGIVMRGSAVALGALAASAALALPLVQGPGSGAPEVLQEARPGGVQRVVVAHPVRSRPQSSRRPLRRDTHIGLASPGRDARTAPTRAVRPIASVPGKVRRARPSTPSATARPATLPVELGVPAARGLAQAATPAASTPGGEGEAKARGRSKPDRKQAPAKAVLAAKLLEGGDAEHRPVATAKPEQHETKSEQGPGGGKHDGRHKKD